jgi:hypothetical protein
VLVTLGRAIRENERVKEVVSRMRKRLVRLGPERVRRYLLWLLLIFLAGEFWLAWSADDSRGRFPHYSVIPAANVGRMRERRGQGSCFGSVWDSLMADTAIKGNWERLVKLRPGLMDTVNQLKRMDSAEWVR